MNEENKNETTETPMTTGSATFVAGPNDTLTGVAGVVAGDFKIEPENEVGEGAAAGVAGELAKDYGEQDPDAGEQGRTLGEVNQPEDYAGKTPALPASEAEGAPEAEVQKYRELTEGEVAEVAELAKREGMTQEKFVHIIDTLSRGLEQALNGSVFGFRLIVVNDRGEACEISAGGAASAALRKLDGTVHAAQMANSVVGATQKVAFGL